MCTLVSLVSGLALRTRLVSIISFKLIARSTNWERADITRHEEISILSSSNVFSTYLTCLLTSCVTHQLHVSLSYCKSKTPSLSLSLSLYIHSASPDRDLWRKVSFACKLQPLHTVTFTLSSLLTLFSSLLHLPFLRLTRKPELNCQIVVTNLKLIWLCKNSKLLKSKLILNI